MKYFVVIFLCVFCSNIGITQVNNRSQLFWEIKSPKGFTSYLYGTIHSNNRAVFNLPDSLYIVLNDTKLLVMETDMYSISRDLEVRSSAISLNFDTYGLPYTSSNLATETVYGNEDGMPHFLDMYLLNLAQLNGIAYTTLESMETQIALSKTVKGLDEPDSVMLDAVLLESTLEGLYINGDINGIDRILRKYYTAGLYNKMIVLRNTSMANRLDTLLSHQSGVVVLGAAHLGGNYGVLKQLKNRGWTIRLINSDSYPANELKKLMRSKRSFTVVDEAVRLHSEWPGIPIEMDREGLLNFYFFKELGQGNAFTIELIDRSNYEDLLSVAKDYILTPGDAKIIRYVTDDGYIYYEGVSDSYPEGLSWVRVIAGEHAFAVLKAYGGNKFMNSDRPQKFFNNCWFIE